METNGITPAQGVSDIALSNTDVMKECETSISINSDSEMIMKKEISAEPWCERTCTEIKFESVDAPSVIALDSKINLFPLELTKCNSDMPIYSNKEIDSKTEIKEESCWLEEPLYSERLAASELCLQNKEKEASSDDTCILGFSSDASMGKNYVSAQEDYIDFEETNISNSVSSSASSKQRDSNPIGESPALTSTLENNTFVQKGKKVYKCPICDRTFPWMAWLRKHSSMHETTKPYQCQICEKRFTYKQNMNQHYLMHEGKTQYTCKICGKSFNQSFSLKRHTLIHEGKRPYKCQICGKTYAQVYHLKRHYFTHEGQKPYKCEICDKGFTCRQTLKLHYMLHEGKREYKCKICGKSFLQNYHLKSHILNHESKRLYTCEICGKCYTKKQSLKEHYFFHKGHKPYICDICDKSFTYKQSLAEHYLIHEGNRQYTCGICNKSFTHKNYLRKHVSIHCVTQRSK